MGLCSSQTDHHYGWFGFHRVGHGDTVSRERLRLELPPRRMEKTLVATGPTPMARTGVL
jgi:hypothetical protein